MKTLALRHGNDLASPKHVVKLNMARQNRCWIIPLHSVDRTAILTYQGT